VGFGSFTFFVKGRGGFAEIFRTVVTVVNGEVFFVAQVTGYFNLAFFNVGVAVGFFGDSIFQVGDLFLERL
jgi:hypothetical protein